MAKLTLKNATKARDSIMASQKKEIAELYEKWADEIGEKAKYYSHKSNPSAPVSERYFKELQKQLKATSQEVSNEVYKKIKKNMYIVSDSVVKDNVDWLKSFGFDEKGLNAAFSYVPDSIVRNLITGQVYDSGWSLSKRIWSDNEDTLKRIYEVMAGGLAESKSIYEIAKDLEQYVRPSAKKNWNLKTKDGKKIYPKQVDYSAQRLARTLTQHTYQQSFVAATKDNPFVEYYIWHSNGSRVCEICLARDGKQFKKDELPLDHPNGMCVMEPSVDKDMNKKLVEWFNSPDGTYPEIDNFAKNFGYNSSDVNNPESFIKKYGKSGKSYGAWYKSCTKMQLEEAKIAKKLEGLSMEKFYNKYIFDGDPKVLAKKAAKASTSEKNKIPNYKSWIKYFKKQTEEGMLKKEIEWMKKIGNDGIRGIRAYSGQAYEQMNKYLRLLQQGKSEKEAIELSYISSERLKDVKNAIKGLSNVKIEEDLVLRRGTDLGDLAGAFMSGDFNKNRRSLRGLSVETLDGMFSGSIGELGSFTSTSSLYERGFDGDVEVIIYAPKGTSASSIMSISKFGTSEGETLLNAGTKVKCVRIERSDGHMESDIRVFLEIIV